MIKSILGLMTVFFAVAAQGETRVTAYACSPDLSECELVMDNETIDDQIPFMAKKGGRGQSDFISTAASATGSTISVVTNALDGIRTSVLDAGYDNFQGTLSGPGGSISFSFNFSNSSWSMSGHNNLPVTRPEKIN